MLDSMAALMSFIAPASERTQKLVPSSGLATMLFMVSEFLPVARAVAIGTRIERRGVRVRETDPAVVAGTSEELPAVLCAGQAVKVRS